MEKNSEKKVVVDGLTLKLLRKDEKWVFPFVTYYQHGLGSPICLELLEYKEDSNGFEPEAVITVNLPGVERNAGLPVHRHEQQRRSGAGLARAL